MVAEFEVVAPFMQFGTAGLIAWIWLQERRSAQTREGQLKEAHERLMEQRVQLEQLMSVVSENTRASSAVESCQRLLVDVLVRVASKIDCRAGCGGAVEEEGGGRMG